MKVLGHRTGGAERAIQIIHPATWVRTVDCSMGREWLENQDDMVVPDHDSVRSSGCFLVPERNPLCSVRYEDGVDIICTGYRSFLCQGGG